MVTLADLRHEITALLVNESRGDEPATTLTDAINASDLTLSVADATGLTSGIVEIDTELIYVTSTDEVAGTMTVAPWGRGYLGTTGASHALNARVLVNPRYTQRRIIDTVNQVIDDLYPDVFTVDSTDITLTANKFDYALPATADGILNVERLLTGYTDTYYPVRRWKFSKLGTGSVPTVQVEQWWPGETLRVTYRKSFTALSDDADTLSDAGIPDALRDALIYGAVGRLLLRQEQDRVNMRSVEPHERAGQVDGGASVGAGRVYLSLYQDRKDRERAELRSRYPVRVHHAR